MSRVQLVVLGSCDVGKSALTIQYVQNRFVQTYDPTIEDTYRRQVSHEGNSYMLDILDTAGQEEFGALRHQYLRQGEAFLLVFSLLDPATLDTVRQLHQELSQLHSPPPVVIAANKADQQGGMEQEQAAKVSAPH